MKKKQIIRSTRMGAALLALLMLTSTFLATLLTSCDNSNDPDESESTVSTSDGSVQETSGTTGAGTTGSDGTLPPAGTTPTEQVTWDAPDTSGGTVTPEPDPGTDDPVVPDGVLIGDGIEGAGVFPTFSQKGGVYTDTALSVEITAPEGYTVRYTTNGSLPNKSSTAYKGAISINQKAGEATVIRAACFDSQGNCAGQIITQTYVTETKTTSTAYTIMISTDERNLQAMYNNVNAKIERPAHVEMVAPDGSRIISQDVGLRLFGGSSRGLAQKSFKIIARKNGYFGEDQPYMGVGAFTYPFFPARIVSAGKNAGEVLTKYDGLILRNGGNDSLLSTAADPKNPTLLRDGIANEFMHKFAPHVGASLAEFAVVYLNGEYYGILELRENQNEDYVRRQWGVDDNDVVVVKSELDTSRHCNGSNCHGYGCRFCGVWFFYDTDDTAEARAEMDAWIALCKKAISAVNANDETYNRVYEEVASKVDLENVKEYLAVTTYLCNSDWPYNNVRLWRYTGAPIEGSAITDGKWRFATRDMDMAMGRYESSNILPELDNRAHTDMFEWVLVNYVDGYEDVRQSNFPDYPDALYLQGLFAFLLRNDDFRASFAEYARSLASDEASAYLMTLYRTAFEETKTLISDHIDRWGDHIGGGSTAGVWKQACQKIETFIKDRPAIYLEHLDRMLSMYD